MAEEIGEPADSWELADLDASVSRLMISPSERHDPSLGFVDDDLTDTPTSSGYATAATASPSSSGATAVTASGGSFGDVSSDDLVGQVDQFLREALEKPRERLSILRMEQDIENFLHDPRQQQIEFEALPTSYLRLAAHRVAQHYSLQSIAMPENTMLDGSCSKIVLLKTAKTHFPSVRLADIPVNLPQEEKNKIVKFAIKQRSDRNSHGINSSASNSSKANQPKSVEERKEEYNRARARIFSGSNVGVKSDNEPSISDSLHHFSPVLRQSDIGLSESPDANARRPVGESSSNINRSGRTRMEATVARNEPTSIRQKATSKVAILRDRDVDRKDPDYDRSYDRYMQRFDPGFGFNVGTYTMQPLYSPVANYNTEFPQLGSGQRPQITIDHHARQMPHHLHPSWGTTSSPTAHAYGPPEGIMSPFNANHGPVRTSSPIYLPPQYMSTPRPGMTYINPLEHLQPFAQTHQQQTDANFGLARPR